jgi:glucose-1-phosphate thymidylyltransferase
MSLEVAGLVPAAGAAKRVSPLPGSKELFPIGFREIEVDGHLEIRPKVISQYLLDSMFQAGAKKVWIVVGKHKVDILQYYADGTDFGGHIAYLVMDNLWGMPYTLDQAYPWLNQDTILFGMPDTIFAPADAFTSLLETHNSTMADVTLGVFPTDQPQKLCPVEMDEKGRVFDMNDKPTQTETMNTWGCACWSPCFTEFMHAHLAELRPEEKEVVLASVFRAAIRSGLVVNGVFFSGGEYLDIGTAQDLVTAVRRLSST